MWKWFTLLSFKSEADIAAEGRSRWRSATQRYQVALARKSPHVLVRPRTAPSRTINRSKWGGVPDEIPGVTGAPMSGDRCVAQGGRPGGDLVATRLHG
jgi:tyrosyl-tRNA synthetase